MQVKHCKNLSIFFLILTLSVSTLGSFFIFSVSALDESIIVHDISSSNLVISDNATYSVSGTTTQYNITVSTGCSPKVILNGVSIDVSAISGKGAFVIAENSTGNVIVEIADSTTNSLKSGQNRAGIDKSSSLGSAVNMVGTLTINGGLATSENTGTLYALGGLNAAGIGGGSQKSAGEIIINGGKLTTRSNGLEYNVVSGCASSIGGGGGGSALTQKYARVTINGGYIDATTGSYSAVIGTGDWNAGGCAYVTLNGGYIYVNNENIVNLYPAIGGGYQSHADVTVTGGTIYNLNPTISSFIGAPSEYTLTKSINGGSFNADVTSLIDTSQYKCLYSSSSELYTVLPISYYSVTCFLDGNYYESYALESGSLLNTLPQPNMTGYAFDGWYSESGLVNKVSTMPNENITVYAQMLEKQVKLNDATDKNGFNYKYGNSSVIGGTLTILSISVDSGYFTVNNSTVAGSTGYTALSTTGAYSIALNTSTQYKTITLHGTFNAIDLQAFLRGITFTLQAGVVQNTSVSLCSNELNDNMGVLVDSEGVTHYYEFISGTKSWKDSYNEAKTKTYNGLTGYLATITSKLEHDYIYNVVDGASGWIGGMRVASNYTGAFDTTTAAYTEGGSNVSTNQYWYWTNGPEAGKRFFTQNSYSGGGANYILDGINYSNWNNGEPNAANGLECYAQYGFSTTKLWNDLSSTNYTTNIVGYYIEYSAYSYNDVDNVEIDAPSTDTASYGEAIITFNANGGTVSPATKTVVLGNTYGQLPTPIKAGYSFNGWFTAIDGGAQILTATQLPSTDDHTLYAHWTLNQPTITNSNHYSEVYDSNNHTISVSANSSANVTYTYQWYKNEVLIDGANTASYTVKDVADSGIYTCNVTINDGTQTASKTSAGINVVITKVNITLTADTNSKTYDGTALTDNGYSITSGSFVAGESFDTVTVAGSQLYVGSSNNVITGYTLSGTTNADNYNITLANGTLTINKAAIAITITADSNSKTYDGQALTDGGYTLVGSLATGDSETVVVTGTITNFGIVDNNVTTVTIYHNGVDVTENYVITKVKGSLTINKRNLTITANSGSKTYDGTALTDNGYSITSGSFVAGESFDTVTVAGSQLYVGSSNNVITGYTLSGTTNADNYNITLANGTLTINKAAIAITITADSNSKTYDGQALTDGGYTLVGSLATGDSETVVVTGTITNFGIVDNNVTTVTIYHNGVDVTENYVITKVKGSLTINKRNLTITANSGSKTYDGTALTDNGYSITSGSFVAGESFDTVTVAGSQLYVGSSNNVITGYTLSGTTNADNYNITLANGTLTINKAAIAITITADSNSKTYDGQALTDGGYTLVGSLATGDSETVVVTGTITNFGIVDNNVTTVTIYHNGVDVTENYVITKVKGSLTINKRNLTITANSGSKTYDGTALTDNGYSITSGSFVAGESFDTVTVAGSQLYVGSSNNVITGYTLSGTTNADNYNITLANGTLTINKAAIAITITADSNSKTYDGQALTDGGYTLVGSLATGDSETVVVTGTITNFGIVDNNVTTVTIYHNGVDVTENYVITKVKGSLTINKRNLTITANSGSKTYDGTALTDNGYSITSGSFVAGESFDTVTVAGSQLYVGSSNNVITGYTLSGTTNADNYNITLANGTLTINKAAIAITITADSNSKTYDGQALTDGGYTLVGSLATGDSETVVVTGTITNFGIVDNNVTTVTIYHNGVDVTENYVITKVKGSLTINKRNLTITANSGSKTYDGTALTDNGYSITSGSFVAGEGFDTVTVAGSQLYVGSSNNVITGYTLSGTTNADNYNITLANGTLTINKAAIAITITADSNSKTYDGQALTDGGYTLVGSLATGDSETVVVTGTITNFGIVDNNVTTVTIYHNGVDVTENYVITKVKGSLTINKRNLTITANSGSKTYDGTALTDNGYSITSGSFVAGESFDTVTVAGSQLYVGSSNNVITGYTLSGTTNADNYNITLANGTLTINKAAIAITITADSNSKTYDGQALTDGGYTLVGSLATGDSETVVVTGTITNFGIVDNNVTTVTIYHNGVDVTENYVITKVKGSLTINKRNLTITANSGSKTYDGTALTDNGYSITSGSFVAGESFDTVTVAGSQLYVGSSNNVITGYTLSGTTNADNYNITLANGTLTINKAAIAITITADSNSKTYDGQALTDGGYTLVGSLATGDSETVVVTGTITNFGIVDNNVTTVTIYHNGVDVTENYVITKVKGSLTINKRNLTITANSGSKTYDGTALTDNGYSITSGSFVAGESFDTVTVAGSQLYVGSSNNVITGYTLSGTTNADNYNITLANGTLTINKAAIAITITADSNSKTYDGQALTDGGYTLVGSLATGDSETVVVTGTITNFGIVDNNVTTVTIYHNGVDVTENYVITKVKGSLTINKRNLTITANSDSKTYDGTALTDNGYSITSGSFVAGEGFDTVTVAGSQLYVGSSNNVITGYTLSGTTNADNYNITLANGTLTINKAAIAITITADSNSKTYDGQALTDGGYTLVGSLATGDSETVVVTGTITNFGIVDNNVTTVTIYHNGVDVTENYVITKVKGSLTINKRNLTITANSDSKTYDGTALTDNGYSITSGSFVAGEGFDTVTVAGSQLYVGSSNNVITGYTLSGTTNADNYNITLANGTLTINKAAIAITITADSNSKTYDGQALTDGGYTLVGSLATGDSETVVVTGTITNFGIVDNNVTTVTIYHNGVDVTENYVITKVKGSLTINKRNLTITANSGSKTYDGTALTDNGYSITSGSFVAGEGFDTVTVAGSQLYVGSSNNVITGYTLSGTTNADNYNITLANGTLTINKAAIAITITADSNSKTYDGQALTDGGYTLVGSLATGDSETVVVTGTITNFGIVDNNVTTVTIYHNGVDVTENYVITKVKGSLTINKRNLTITANSDSKTYDGTALTDNGYSITSGSFVAGEGFDTVTVAGSQLYVGSSNNVITGYTLSGTTNADNYNITLANGTLTINKAAIAITITADSNSKTYDGQALTDGGYTLVGSLATGDSETVVVTGTITNFGIVDNNVTTVTIYHNGVDVTENYVITKVKGSLTINKRNLTITANSDSKTYDGTALTDNGYSITSGSFVAGEGFDTVTVAGSQLYVGSSNNVITGYTLSGTTNADNYNITLANGTLTINKAAIAITITADSNSKTYDGQALTDGGYTLVGSLATGDSETVVVTGTITNFGIVDNNVTTVTIYHNGVDVTENYVITKVKGSLTINKRNLTITANSGSKTYDGTALTDNGYSITSGSFVAGEGFDTVTVAGSQLYVGSSNNVITGYTLSGTTNADNYNITLANGTLTINKAAIAITITADSNSKTYDGQALTDGGYTLVGSLATGDSETVVVTGTITNFGIVDNNVTTVTIYHNGVDVTENYVITKVKGSLTINKRNLTITANSDSKTYDGTALTDNGYSITSGSFVAGESFDTVTVAGSQLYVGSSNNVITGYTLSGTTNADNYNITLANGTLTINKAAIAITITADSNSKTYDGQALTDGGYTLVGSLATGDSETVVVTGTITNFGIVDNNVTTVTIYHNGVDVTENYVITKVKGSLTINKRNLTITANSDSKTYDGTALTDNGYSITSGSFVAGEGFDTVTVAGSQLYVGSSNNVITGYTLSGTTNADNYNITLANGTLTINKAAIAITITADSNSKTYNGQALTDGGYTLVGSLATGDSETVVVTGTITNFGIVDNNVTTVTIYHNGVDVTENYVITKVKGSLTINKRNLTITANSGSKTYDGTALTDNGYSITSGSFVAGEGFDTVTVAGSQLYVGSSNNVITGYTLSGTTNADNYNITLANGTLTINKAAIAITITADSNSKTYNGQALTDGGYTLVGSLATGDSETVVVTGTITNFGIVDNNVTTVTIYHNGVDVTENYVITKVKGSLTINKRNLTITANSGSKTYDGTALTDNGYSITSGSFVAGESFDTVTVAGSQSDAGTSNNTISYYTFTDTTNSDNYNVTTVKGTLTVGQAQSSISDISDISRVSNGTPVAAPTYTIIGDGEVTIEYYSGDSLLQFAPTTAGTYTVKIIIADGKNYIGTSATKEFTITKIPTQTKIESDGGVPAVETDNFDNLFDEPVTDSTKGVTQEEIDNASDIVVTFIAKDIEVTTPDEDLLKNNIIGKDIGLLVDLSIVKKVTYPNGDVLETNITETNDVVKVIIPIPDALKDKEDLVVYRVHEGVITTFNTTPDENGEYFEIDGDNIIIYSKFFSTYAVAYNAETTPPTGENTNFVMYITIMLASANIIAYTIYYKKRRAIKKALFL